MHNLFSNVYCDKRYIEQIIYTIDYNTIENDNEFLLMHANLVQTCKLLLLHHYLAGFANAFSIREW